MVRTPPSHGGNRDSNSRGITKQKTENKKVCCFFIHRREPRRLFISSQARKRDSNSRGITKQKTQNKKFSVLFYLIFHPTFVLFFELARNAYLQSLATHYERTKIKSLLMAFYFCPLSRNRTYIWPLGGVCSIHWTMRGF